MLILTFENTHQAMSAQKSLEQAQISLLCIPTPREIDKSCGLSLRLEEDQREALQTHLASHALPIKAIYRKVDLHQYEIDPEMG